MTDWEQGVDEYEADRPTVAQIRLEQTLTTMPPLKERAVSYRPTVPARTRQDQVAAEITKLEQKLDKARQLHERLANIPHEDPWGDDAVLRVAWRGYTYVLLRAKGLWYSTGRANSAPYRFTWIQLVDWLIAGGVESVTFLAPTEHVWLGGVVDPELDRPFLLCDQRATTHAAHSWRADDSGIVYWCEGSSARQCRRDTIHAGHEWVLANRADKSLVVALTRQTYWCPGLTSRQCGKPDHHAWHRFSVDDIYYMCQGGWRRT